MDIQPTPDQQALIRHAIDAGRSERPEDAAAQAMALWEENERRRMEILARIDEAEASIAIGKGIVITRGSQRRQLHDHLSDRRHRRRFDSACL